MFHLFLDKKNICHIIICYDGGYSTNIGFWTSETLDFFTYYSSSGHTFHPYMFYSGGV